MCDWKPLDWICHYASVQGLWGLPVHTGAITTSGEIHEKCYYWLCFMGVGVELVNEIYAGPLGKLIYPFRSCCQCCQRMSYRWCPREWAEWMKSFSDQWRDHFSILVLIIPDGIVKENRICGERLREAVLTQVVSSLKHYLQNKYLRDIVKISLAEK